MAGENEQHVMPPAPEYKYPIYLRGHRSNFITFTCNEYVYGGSGGPPVGSVSFYHTGNIAFADGASYTTFDMGAMGREVANAIGNDGNLTNVANKAIASITDQKGTLKNFIGAKILASTVDAVIPDSIINNASQIYSNVKGIAVNPNTTAAFTNMNIRTYLFNFKMIAEEPEDSARIRDIQTFIRRNTYAALGSEGFLLSYPPTWKITFHTEDGRQNPYYPRIYECFLTNFQTTFNASSHLHHDGGAPVEVDVSMTFQETKVLTQNDIDNLSTGPG